MRWLLLPLFLSTSASACVCGGYPSAKDAWQRSSAVFVGHIAIAFPNSKPSNPPTTAQASVVRVEEAFKGSANGQVFLLWQPGHDCAPKFRTGERVLLYLDRSNRSVFWNAPACGRTRSLDDAADDLLFLRALPGSASKSRVAGAVVLYENSVAAGFRRSRSVAGIHVHIRSQSRTIQAVTDTNGVYEVFGLPPDEYRIGIDVPENLRIYFPLIAGGVGRRDRLKDLDSTEPSVVIRADGAVDVDFVLLVDNQISGRVLDPRGRPLKDVCVRLAPAAGEASPYFYISTCSEADGSYTLKDMPASEYVMTAQRWATGRDRGPVVYYPGTTDRKDAAILPIGNGEHLSGFVIRIP